MKKLWYIVIGIFFLYLGIRTYITQELPVAGGRSGYVHIGEFAYIVSFLFIVISFNIFYMLFKQIYQNKK